MNRDELQRLIDEHIDSDDQQFATIYGYFLNWYAVIEVGLTSILAALSKAEDPQRFHVLCGGMDMKAKIERIRKMAAIDGGVGPNLSARLDHLYGKISRTRNKLVHNAARLNSKNKSRVQLVSLDLMGKASFDFDKLDGLEHHLTVHDLFNHTLWMRQFVPDISQVQITLAQGGALEIDRPHTELPTGGPHPQ